MVDVYVYILKLGLHVPFAEMNFVAEAGNVWLKLQHYWKSLLILTGDVALNLIAIKKATVVRGMRPLIDSNLS